MYEDSHTFAVLRRRHNETRSRWHHQTVTKGAEGTHTHAHRGILPTAASVVGGKILPITAGGEAVEDEDG
jgi:hypothetical protein